jgi:signal transduction histidine kinase
MEIGLVRQPERIDTRVALRVYAILAAITGWMLINPVWLGARFGGILDGPPWNDLALFRVCGSIVVAAACCAVGLSVVDDALARRRAFGWFIVAHVAVLAMLVLQRIAIWPSGLADQAIWVLAASIVALTYIWFTFEGEGATTRWMGIRLFEPSSSASVAVQRSRHDQQIRDAVGREERNRLARDLHDSVKQQVFAIQTAAATAETRFDGDPAGAREAIARVRASAREAAAEMEALLDELRAVPLDTTGLVEALRKQSDALGYRTGAHVTFDIGALPPADALEPSVYDAVFRVGQEALANVARHARAATVGVSLDARGGQLELVIHDDGAGFDPLQWKPGMGMANMRARADEIGATLQVTGQPGAGATVRLSVPYATPELLRSSRRRVLQRAALWLVILATAVFSLVTGRLLNSVFGIMAMVALARYAAAYRRLRAAGALAR